MVTLAASWERIYNRCCENCAGLQCVRTNGWTMTLSTNCEGITRRHCLQLGLGTMVGGGLVDILRLKGTAANPSNADGPAKACILIWMDGGPTHFETFDPKPGASIASGTTAIDTSIKGIQLATGYEQTADVMDEIALVRSVVSKEGDHGEIGRGRPFGEGNYRGPLRPGRARRYVQFMPEQVFGVAIER